MSSDLDLLLGMPQPARKHNIGYALVDQNLTVLANNPAVQEWTITGSEELVGYSLFSLFPELIGLEEILHELIPKQTETVHLAKIHRASSDGLGRYFNLQIEPMFYFGSILLVTVTDVTAQAHLEHQLRQERNELRLQVKERERVEAALQEAKESLEKAVAKRTTELRQANEWLQFELQERRRMEEARAKLEDQLRQAHKMEAVGRLAGGLAHDFNNLLTVITGYTDLLLIQHQTGDNLTHRNLNEIKKAAERAAALTGQLLAFSRKQVLQPKVLDVNGVVAETEKMLRRLIGEDIELVTWLAPDLKPIEADPNQLAQVLLNLAINARDAMPNGGKLIIETANITIDSDYAYQHLEVIPGQYVLLTICDNGVGMSEEVKAHLFEPFFTTKELGQGTGLGLATCFGIVKQSSGYIEVNSELGQGTTFKVYLPSVDVMPEGLVKPDQIAQLPIGTETILLVEDEPMVRELAGTVLRQQGYTVLEAANGEDGLRLMTTQPGKRPLDLLVTDVVMPRLSGKELADQLWTTFPDLKVLFISGYTNNIFTHPQNLPTRIAFLQKPFSPATLLHKVREVLDHNYSLKN